MLGCLLPHCRLASVPLEVVTQACPLVRIWELRPDKERQTLGPYRDCPGTVSLGVQERPRCRGSFDRAV
jgi:hypothetical protein